MSDSSGGSSGTGNGTLAVLFLAAIALAIILVYPGSMRGFVKWAADKASELSSTSQLITVCKKSSKYGIYSVTDASGTRYAIAGTVHHSQKQLTAKEAYDVFKKGRASVVRVSIRSEAMGQPTITWIESASRKLEAAKCPS